MTKALMVGAREKDSFDFGGLSIRRKVDGNEQAIMERRAWRRRSRKRPDLCQRFGLTFPAL